MSNAVRFTANMPLCVALEHLLCFLIRYHGWIFLFWKQIQFIEPDTCILVISDAINKDEGLYSLSARNIAGTVSSSVMVHIEESEQEYGYLTYSKGRNIKPKSKPFEECYDIGDELGRGTQGVTYHAVERMTGNAVLWVISFLSYFPQVA